MSEDPLHSAADSSPSPIPQSDLGAPDLLVGFHNLLHRTGVTAAATLEGSSLAYALAEVLVSRGILGLDEVDRVRQSIQARLAADLVNKGVTVRLSDNAPDKYRMQPQTAEIDCDSRLHLCHAACCRLRFALAEQDVEEGIVHWSLREPYLNRQSADGYCVHIQPDRLCSIYENRPSVCRSYDCRGDKRIWVDFEARIPNPRLLDATGPSTEPASQPKSDTATETPP
ncbi:MAG TPA: YkgJ family cysteine cluster protein [Dehalococcoidia bacterium]|jgi:Fe-S-cluster containining protein